MSNSFPLIVAIEVVANIFAFYSEWKRLSSKSAQFLVGLTTWLQCPNNFLKAFVRLGLEHNVQYHEQETGSDIRSASGMGQMLKINYWLNILINILFWSFEWKFYSAIMILFIVLFLIYIINTLPYWLDSTTPFLQFKDFKNWNASYNRARLNIVFIELQM